MFKIKRIVALLLAVAMIGSCISISPSVYADMKIENDSAPLDLDIDLSGRELLTLFRHITVTKEMTQRESSPTRLGIF